MNEHVCAFVRRKGDRWVLVAAPRFSATLTGRRAFPLGRRVWGEGVLSLPDGAPGGWWDVFGDEEIVAEGGQMKLAKLFAWWPVAVLWGEAGASALFQSSGIAG
jgi:(1->4)-alpha-D-glucan 1-alpha-D-glucosylmutase